MQYLRIKNLEPDMVLARPLMGDNGSMLANAGNVLTENIIKRIINMGFQGAYIDNPTFSDIIVDDVISDDIRYKAFQALQSGNVRTCVPLAKQLVKDIKNKEVLDLDLLDIKSDSNFIYKHLISVTIFAIVLGVGYGLTEEQLENLAVAGMLHDIGKLELRKQQANDKQGNELSSEDIELKHPEYAYEILQQYPEISSVTRNAILFHHENVDGTGYKKVSGEKLTIFPRILRIVDAYDTMTSHQISHDAFTPADAIEYLMSNVDTLFDKELVEVFVRRVPVYPLGFTLMLSNDESGVVTSNKSNSMRPWIRLMDGKDVDLAMDPDYRSVLISGIY